MVKFTLLAATIAAAMSGMVMADDCKHGLAYCGYNLLRKGNYFQDISNSLAAAEQPLDDAHINYSVFYCKGDDDVPFQGFCGSNNCQDGGSGKSDYCL
ncbi:hypothetical protein BJ170DRAFT_358646 [Xylariales sp. AK1849]|nr:hypothetical protein BJ170DRAFT_358646 [Xylariales sp. AK1849]